jgi:alkanesulfonate monooxygenase SsuD/methylene tetrahydromethanopterin reductase-like flavin-dependent oxidoreductase (luciferase family)
MSTPKRFHLGWFINFTVNAWDEPWADNNGPDWTGGFYIDMARALDRACFDYMILEDTCMVSDTYGGSFASSLKHAVFAPKHDPLPLVPLIAQATSRLGVVATMSTSFYPPFLSARLSATLDHICRGRFGWNIVTSGEDRAEQTSVWRDSPSTIHVTTSPTSTSSCCASCGTRGIPTLW